jgi:5-methylcytosine-specific restriction protein A
MTKPRITMAKPRIATVGPRVKPLGRPNPQARGYDTNWHRAARAFKRSHPWCLGCSAVGMRTPTTVVDHVRPPMGDLQVFWNMAMWQPCCDRCHESTKKKLEHAWRRGEISVAELWLNSPRAIGMTRSAGRG